jgi:glycosyltransferase involved in cell wall biosynthesis
MRILYIATMYPLGVNNGVKMRVWHLLRAIANAGHEITLATFVEPEEPGPTQRELSKVCKDSEIVVRHMESLSGSTNYVARLSSILSPSPYTLDRCRSDEMRARLEHRLRSDAFDVVLCDNVFTTVNLPPTALPLLMNSHNVEHVTLQRYAEQESNPFKALYARLEAGKLRRFEASAYKRAVFVMVCSRLDGELIEQLCPGVRTIVAPNVVDVHDYEMTGEEDPLTVVYQGGMDWFPNRDALEYFVRAILPLVQKEMPGVRLIAAGRNPTPEFRARFSHVPALEFTGTLPDLRPVIARAAICIVPLRIGSGTRLKILEGGAMSKAMVSTTIGAEGLDFVPGKEILIADDPAAFARSVVELLRDPARRKAMGEAARKRVSRDYDVTALERSIADAFQSVQQSIRTEAGRAQLAAVGQGESAC